MPTRVLVAVVAIAASTSVIHGSQTLEEKVSAFNTLTSDNAALEENIAALCAEEWEDDFRMQRYCREQQLEGYNNLSKIWGEALTNIRNAAASCLDDWSEDLLFDWRMIHYCTSEQLEAWRELR